MSEPFDNDITEPDIDATDVGEDLLSHEKLALLNHITMDIRVEIGRAKIKLHDLLNLKKGMILELNQPANEPLPIYANDKIIARGTIISANGKYCIKLL